MTGRKWTTREREELKKRQKESYQKKLCHCGHTHIHHKKLNLSDLKSCRACSCNQYINAKGYVLKRGYDGWTIKKPIFLAPELKELIEKRDQLNKEIYRMRKEKPKL